MGDDSASGYKSSFTLTAAKLDLSNPLNATLVGVYLYVADHPASWGQNPSAKSIYSSSFAWASQHIQGVDLGTDYPLLLVGERAKDQVKVYLADFSKATDVQSKYPVTSGVPDYLYFDSTTFSE